MSHVGTCWPIRRRTPTKIEIFCLTILTWSGKSLMKRIFLSIPGTPLFEVQPWTVPGSHTRDMEWSTSASSERRQNAFTCNAFYDCNKSLCKHGSGWRQEENNCDGIILKSTAETTKSFRTWKKWILLRAFHWKEKIKHETLMVLKETVLCISYK